MNLLLIKQFLLILVNNIITGCPQENTSLSQIIKDLLFYFLLLFQLVQEFQKMKMTYFFSLIAFLPFNIIIWWPDHILKSFLFSFTCLFMSFTVNLFFLMFFLHRIQIYPLLFWTFFLLWWVIFIYIDIHPPSNAW